MRALGAIPVPTVHGRWPGSIDILRKMLYSFHNDHAVQFVQETALTHGNLFQVNILGQKKVSDKERNTFRSVLILYIS